MGKNSFGSGKPTTFLNITSDGMITQILKAKNESEAQSYLQNGYKRTENTNPKTKEIVISYRKSWPSVSGYITNVAIEDNSIIGETLKIKIEDNEECNIISIPMWNQKGQLNGYAVDFIRLCDNIPFDEEINFGANRKLKNEAGFLVQLLTIQYKERTNDKGMELMARTISKEDVPELDVTMVGNKKIYNSSKRDGFLYDALTKFIAKLNQHNDSHKNEDKPYSASHSNVGESQNVSSYTPTQQQPPQQNQNSSQSQFSSGVEEVDDLPF